MLFSLTHTIAAAAKHPFPCRGYLSLLGTPEGQAVASWPAGSAQNWNITGIGNHYGGSCQVGFSVDKGETFRVAASYEGNCPHRNGGTDAEGQNFNFTVPDDLPEGDVVFAWTWFNREQEFNMNCAAVAITASEGANDVDSPTPSASADPALAHVKTFTVENCTCKCDITADADIQGDGPTFTADACSCTCPRPPIPAVDPAGYVHGHDHDSATSHEAAHRRMHRRTTGAVVFADRPGMLFADIGNGCLTPRTSAELKYPNPGPEVFEGDGEYPLELPTPAGKCGY